PLLDAPAPAAQDGRRGGHPAGQRVEGGRPGKPLLERDGPPAAGPAPRDRPPRDRPSRRPLTPPPTRRVSVFMTASLHFRDGESPYSRRRCAGRLSGTPRSPAPCA